MAECGRRAPSLLEAARSRYESLQISDDVFGESGDDSSDNPFYSTSGDSDSDSCIAEEEEQQQPKHQHQKRGDREPGWGGGPPGSISPSRAEAEGWTEELQDVTVPAYKDTHGEDRRLEAVLGGLAFNWFPVCCQSRSCCHTAAFMHGKLGHNRQRVCACVRVKERPCVHIFMCRTALNALNVVSVHWTWTHLADTGPGSAGTVPLCPSVHPSLHHSSVHPLSIHLSAPLHPSVHPLSTLPPSLSLRSGKCGKLQLKHQISPSKDETGCHSNLKHISLSEGLNWHQPWVEAGWVCRGFSKHLTDHTNQQTNKQAADVGSGPAETSSLRPGPHHILSWDCETGTGQLTGLQTDVIDDVIVSMLLVFKRQSSCWWCWWWTRR